MDKDRGIVHGGMKILKMSSLFDNNNFYIFYLHFIRSLKYLRCLLSWLKKSNENEYYFQSQKLFEFTCQ